ncbi:hypothetical protein RJ641_021844 [Dillenia turbinata]|uniref:Uncharacterized protein n=1 Tax=Dillenia turbinata TaxID=194707 RepID=A0AAN8YYU5_9MAGN
MEKARPKKRREGGGGGGAIMLRIRLLSFAVGFSVTGAAISHFFWRDLMNDRFSISSQLKQRYDALNARVLNLESVGHENRISLQLSFPFLFEEVAKAYEVVQRVPWLCSIKVLYSQLDVG